MATSCRLGSLSSGTYNGVDLSCRSTVSRSRASATTSRASVRSMRSRPVYALRLPRREQLQLDAGDVEPPDRAGACSTSSLTRSERPRARSVTNTRTSTRTIRKPNLRRRPEDRRHVVERVVERVPAGWRARVEWTTPSMRGVLNGWQLSGISTMASGRPDSAQLLGRRRATTTIAAAWFGTADVVGPSNHGGQRPGARLHLRPAAGRLGRRREADGSQLHRRAGLRRERRASSRRTTCGSRRDSTTT